MNDRIMGNVDSASAGRLVVGEFAGRAGFRTVADDRLEISYFGKPPREFPCDATLDGEAITVIASGPKMNANASTIIAERNAP